MACYRCVGNVLRYYLEELTEELNEYHPLKSFNHKKR